jgi:hypothetical protein
MPDIEIVKVQRPTTSFDPEHTWMVYAKHRDRVAFIPQDSISKKIKKALGYNFTGYFKATWHPVDGWDIGNRTKEKSW